MAAAISTPTTTSYQASTPLPPIPTTHSPRFAHGKALLRLQLHTLTVLKETIDERDEPVPVLQEGDQDLAIVVEVDEIVVPRFDEDLMVVEEQNGEGVLERERRGFIRRAIEGLYFTFERVFGGF
ncbi:hypothetical protein PC9H_001154 [Pleurotus ostreatus]|uniref:Uncharacterized protein n=1 Tax=Pleurotus ostreatus TaxID=5322 RepID=A0A8H7A6B5_PLEOS|nr:uncharacterized protein PC9H_001154 [Pleurotus ostreatus]KAF7440806.1 hypothetical protein PC9H_001154 [Pleurotus ostreatus]